MPGTLPMADPPRVPAWKKLGLQLKFANQDATPPSTDRPKKRRKRNDAQPEPDEDPSLVSTLDQKSSQEVTETVTPKSKKIEKSKSVTFTPETKKEDGDSIKQLFGAWVQSQKEEALTSEGWGGSDNAGIAEPQAEAQPTKKKKAKARKSKAQAATALESSSETVHPAIGYLHQYRLDRDHWKFNKARQSYILKHIFDLDRIPKTCTVALGEYIAGLQGDAARSRINKEAEEIINNDIEWSASQVDETEEEGKKKNIFKSAVKEFMSRMQEPKWYVKPDVESATPLENEEAKRLLKRKRAHVLLEVLGPGTTTRPELSEDIKEQTLSQTSSTDVTGVPKTRRMRKRRTTDISDDDTSSDSESESSSDDSSASDDTMSSSDSDSDSNSNSDSESDSSEESDSSSDSD